MNHTLVAGASSVCATASDNALLGQVSFCSGCLVLLLSLQWTPSHYRGRDGRFDGSVEWWTTDDPQTFPFFRALKKLRCLMEIRVDGSTAVVGIQPSGVTRGPLSGRWRCRHRRRDVNISGSKLMLERGDE